MEDDAVLEKIKSMPLFCCVLLLLLLGGILLAVLPARSFSELENRPLAAASDVRLLSDTFAQDWEKYASDHFPGRDAFVRLHASLEVLTGKVLQDGVFNTPGGVLIEVPVDEVTRTAERNMETLSEIQSALKLPMSVVLIPTSAAIMPDSLPALYSAADQQSVIGMLHTLCPEAAPVSAGLVESRASDLYYRTDHHLTARGAWIVYERLCEHLHLTPQAAPRTSVEGFLGSYYARIPGFHIRPETFTADLPAHITLTLDGVPQPSLLNEAALQGRSKYAALLSETYGHAVLTGGEGEGALLVLSDSYANAIVPLLAQHFRRVDVIDPRYFVGVLSDTAEASGSTRILALFGLNTISNNRGLALLDIGEELE